MWWMSSAALALQRVDFRVMAMSCLRSSVAISPTKRSVTAIDVACGRVEFASE